MKWQIFEGERKMRQLGNCSLSEQNWNIKCALPFYVGCDPTAPIQEGVFWSSIVVHIMNRDIALSNIKINLYNY